jgi:hypothetical protein
MEALALLFVIGVFIALLVPERKPKKPSAGDNLLKGLKEAAGEVFDKSILNTEKPPPKDNPWAAPWAVMLYTILLGILLTTL